MHKLRVLIWKACKVRLKSPLTTTLDIGGPIVLAVIYICLKFIIISSDSFARESNESLFRNVNTPPLDATRDLNKYLCTEILYFSEIYDGNAMRDALISECGIKTVETSGRSHVFSKLKTNLESRVAYKGADLLRQNSSRSDGGCFTLPDSNKTLEEFGIVYEGNNSFQFYSTEAAQNPVIHSYYALGSLFNEQKFPHSQMNTGLHLIELCTARAFHSTLRKRNSSMSTMDIKWNIKPVSTLGTSSIVPVTFMILILLGYMCPAAATIIRTTDEIESGLHRYIRLAGVPAGIYWSGSMIVILIHMALEGLMLAFILGLPIADTLFDPINDSDFTLRWAILFSYGFALNSHALFVGSVFSRVSHVLLVTCFLGVVYSVYPLILLLKWTPYGYTNFSIFASLFMFINPVSNMEGLLLVLNGVAMNTAETFHWRDILVKVPGEQYGSWNVAEMWFLLILQGTLWFLATIIVDQMAFNTSGGIIGFLSMNFNELFCCNTITPKPQPKSQKSQKSSNNENLQNDKPDPNRICCAIKDLSVIGPKALMAHTRPHKKTVSTINNIGQASKTHQYEINRTAKRSEMLMQPSQFGEPITLDNVVQQNISWYSIRLAFENLNVNFRFNQVSFVLGTADLKDLLFETLLGFKKIKSGSISIDNARFSPDNIKLARPHIGYLGERDIYLNEITIFENLQLFGSLRDESYNIYDSESSFVLSLLHLYTRKDNLPSVLTTRSARKLSLAAAAVGHTKLLLLVEPTMGLRWKPRCQVLNLLKKYKSIRSIVVDTSDIDEACAFADRLILLKNEMLDMDGSPSELSRNFHCGNWLIFEYQGEEAELETNLENLNKLLASIFKDEKIGKLDESYRSIYQDLIDKYGSRDSAIKKTDKITAEEIHKKTIILKARPSRQTSRSICKTIKMFSQHNIHGFHFSALDYESLEDLVVVRLSKGFYPHLPPELLLSLQHRTKIQNVANDISVRELSDSGLLQTMTKNRSFGPSLKSIFRDRLQCQDLLVIIVGFLAATLMVSVAMLYSKFNLNLSYDNLDTSEKMLGSTIEIYYKHRVSLQFLDNAPNIRKPITNWKGDLRLIEQVPSNLNESDVIYVKKTFAKNKDLLSSLVFYNPSKKSVSIVYEPNFPFSLVSAMRMFNFYYIANDDLSSSFKSSDKSEYVFPHPWHEILRGQLNKRFLYGVGFAISEGIAIGVFAVWPIRHRAESKVVKVQTTYWLAMAIFDFSMSLVLIMIYMTLFIAIEGVTSSHLLLCLFLVFTLYKLATIPLAYICSLAIHTPLNGFLFILFLKSTIVWVFGIQIRTLFDWTMQTNSYSYDIGLWFVKIFPTNALLDALVNIAHINRINELCPEVPAFTATKPIINEKSSSIMDGLFEKVEECLANSKSGINVDVMNESQLGILWDVYILTIFVFIAWPFLLFSERVFGIFARRFVSKKSQGDPLKTVIRNTDSVSTSFRWFRERDRLVSEYIRCLNETKYVTKMATNCLFIRVWLKPLTDQTSLERRLQMVLEPITNLGLARDQIQIELKTTLQIFIRIGTEKAKYNVDKIQLIESFLKFQKAHQDTIVQFAIIDWTRETLYKILLHGHYNTKAVVAGG